MRIDDEWATIGSRNLYSNSLAGHTEMNASIRDAAAVGPSPGALLAEHLNVRIRRISMRVRRFGFIGPSRDAAAFAAMDNTVVAVEPVDEFGAAARTLHQSPLITWLDDSLPNLAATSARDERYDLIMLTAVWMHLDTEERQRAMPKVAALMGDGGMMLMSLRHGPVPPKRRMFEVSDEETVELARLCALDCVLCRSTDSVGNLNRVAGVTWTRLALVKAAGYA